MRPISNKQNSGWNGNSSICIDLDASFLLMMNEFTFTKVRAPVRITVTRNRVDQSSKRILQWTHWCVEVSITKATIHALSAWYLEVCRHDSWPEKCHFLAHRTWYFRETGGFSTFLMRKIRGGRSEIVVILRQQWKMVTKRILSVLYY